jgi:hypothetical protein
MSNEKQAMSNECLAMSNEKENDLATRDSLRATFWKGPVPMLLFPLTLSDYNVQLTGGNNENE